MPASVAPLLVVDDSRLNRIRLTQLLTREGYSVTEAENGLQALELLRAQPYALVLLDMMMPTLNGGEVLRRMKADSALRHVPVIVISALDDMAMVVECIELGAEDYLTRPFDPVLLRARIGACLEKKRLRDNEQAYLAQVARVTAAAAAVEAGSFDVASLDDVAGRTDELGRMARVFQRMAREVFTREQALRQQVSSLQIEVDKARTQRQAAEITGTSYFKDLQEQARQLRAELDPNDDSP